MNVNEQLDELATELEGTEFQEGEATIGPAGQSLEAFQADVQRLRGYAAQGLIEIRSEHKEQWSGDRHVDRVRIRMGPDGVSWRRSY